jgi:hypothetical protein
VNDADFVCAVLPAGMPFGNVLFELGIAAGLGKPLFLIVDPVVQLPPDLRALPCVRTRLDAFSESDTLVDAALQTFLTKRARNGANGHRLAHYFANSMRSRACRDGILVASSGITGTTGTLTEAHLELALALRGGQRILVLSRSEILELSNSAALVDLLKRKILDLTINLAKSE